ncbi:pectate lyase superfamily protein-domain-containing protein [Mycena sp. CBHHK59/15]|nr:pectate lyase superfamily protein-domain-containing protein [Mycena sp. CBHHK59/15]
MQALIDACSPKGDGVTDDTAAINNAITSGNRCGGGSCPSSTLTPAVVFFPHGTYLVKNSIIAYYYTQLIGDAKSPPTLLADASFTDLAVIDADPYIPGGAGAQYYTNQNNFFRSVRNFVIDVTRVPPQLSQGTGIHWQVAQATSLMNIVINMSNAANTAHQGIWMENGSGGFMGDLVFNGGKFGMWVGNQQFTVRNITVNGAQTGVFGLWNWGWTFQGVTFNNCQVGFDLATGGGTATQTVGAEAIIDATVTNTPIFVRTSTASNGKLGGSLVLNNIKLTNVPTASAWLVVPSYWPVERQQSLVGDKATSILVRVVPEDSLRGTSLLPVNPLRYSTVPEEFRQDASTVCSLCRHSIRQRARPRRQGRWQDGRHCRSQSCICCIFRVQDNFLRCRNICSDLNSNHPCWHPNRRRSLVRNCRQGQRLPRLQQSAACCPSGRSRIQGLVEISDIIFSTIGPAAGAVVVEWNVKQTTQGAAGMWDSHIRLGGAAGTNLETANCPSSGSGGFTNCFAAFLGLHLTSLATAYLEGTWVWLADHDLDNGGQTQLSLYSGRGILSESAGPVWMIGTASEHHVVYQYSLVNAQSHYLGLIQTETPYFQPNPAPPAPFIINPAYHDPSSWSGISSAWGLRVTTSTDIIVFGAGLYSFFSNYGQGCLTPENCQSNMVTVDSTSSVHIYSLSTVGTTFQVSVNQAGVVNQSSNQNGFAATVTSWSQS